MHRKPTGNEISRITGITMTKIARHGRMLEMAPPTVGPMAGATVMTSDPTPIRRPTLVRGACSRMMLIINGVATPDPTPWTTRATRITGNAWPKIMISDPNTASATAARNSVRCLNLRLR